MQNSMPLPANGGQNTKRKQARQARKQAKWTLLNLLETWFLSDAGKPVIVDPMSVGGASHDEWRELVRRTHVRIPPEQLNAPWGPIARRDFLNWCEENVSEERKPLLFGSKSDALDWLNFSRQFEDESKPGSKRIEILKSPQGTSEDGGDEPPDIA